MPPITRHLSVLTAAGCSHTVVPGEARAHAPWAGREARPGGVRALLWASPALGTWLILLSFLLPHMYLELMHIS